MQSKIYLNVYDSAILLIYFDNQLNETEGAPHKMYTRFKKGQKLLKL